MNSFHDIDKDGEEFNNFMMKVNEVSSILNNLASNDKDLQAIGDLEAKKYLGDDKEKILEDVGDQEVVLKMKSNRTIINKRAIENVKKDDSTMSQEQFLAEVSKDAEKRYQDRLIRTERMNTFKKQATLAFKRGDFEKALTLYSKAIEQIKDSPLLYNNRALTYINLNVYDKAKEDLSWALRLNEDCLKSWLLLAKINLLEGNRNEYEKSLREAIERNPDEQEFIKSYTKDLEERS